MFNYLEKQKRKQRRNQKARILFFSFMSSLVTATFAIFFSQKANRDKVVKSAKDITQKAKEATADITTKVSHTSQEISKKTMGLYDKYKPKSDTKKSAASKQLETSKTPAKPTPKRVTKSTRSTKSE